MIVIPAMVLAMQSAKLNECQTASEQGFRAGYDDFNVGIFTHEVPYSNGTTVARRWYSAYFEGQVIAHRHKGR